MRLLGQSQPEAQRPLGPIVTPKRQTIIGCWNVRTMVETTQAGQSAKVMKEYAIEVLEISQATPIFFNQERGQDPGRYSLIYPLRRHIPTCVT